MKPVLSGPLNDSYLLVLEINFQFSVVVFQLDYLRLKLGNIRCWCGWRDPSKFDLKVLYSFILLFIVP